MQQIHAQRAVQLSNGNLTYEPGELALKLRVGKASVYKGLREGTIPSIRIGKRFIIPRTAVNDWLKSAGPAGS